MEVVLFRSGRWMSDTSRLLWKGFRTGLEIGKTLTLRKHLMETAKNAVEDNLPDYFSQLKGRNSRQFFWKNWTTLI